MVKRNELYTYSKLFPVISNLIYFILALYISVKITCLNRCGISKAWPLGMTTFALGLITLFLVLSGIFSILYHMNTPAFKDEPYYQDSNAYQDSLNLDSGFAMTSSLIALIILIVYGIYFKTTDMFFNSNMYFLIVFIVLSIVSYIGAGVFWRVSYDECTIEEVENGQNKIGKPCFRDYQNLYNMYHTSWHLFIGFAGFFWAILFFELITPRLKNGK